MNIDFISKEDLMKVRHELLTEIQDLKGLLQAENDQRYLKNKDVKRIYGCSDSKLESLRKSGKLRHTKMQGTVYYKREDVYALLQEQSLHS